MAHDIIIAVIAAVGTAIAPTIIGLLNRRKIDEVHIMMNSRFTEMLQIAVIAAEARGHLAGQQKEKEEQ
jgi:hypothetical protein